MVLQGYYGVALLSHLRLRKFWNSDALFRTKRYLLQEKILREIEFEKFVKPLNDANPRHCVPPIALPTTSTGCVDWKMVDSWPVVLKILRVRSHQQQQSQQQQERNQLTNEINFFNNEINAQLDSRHRNILPLLGVPFEFLFNGILAIFNSLHFQSGAKVNYICRKGKVYICR